MAVRTFSPQPSRAQWLRRLSTRRRNKTALVLSGGGSLGALQVGALRALIERGITFDLVAGTSVGALNGAIISSDPTVTGVDRLERSWRALRRQDLFPTRRWQVPLARFIGRGDHVFPNDGIRALMAAEFGDAAFEDLVLPFAVVTTELNTGRERVFSSGPLLAPVLAATAMPGVFPPVRIGEELLIDGGVCNNVPLATAVNLGATTVYVVDSTSCNHSPRPLHRPLDYMMHAFGLARGARWSVERSLYQERVRIVEVPLPILDFHVPFTSMDFTSELIARSYETARRFLAAARLAAVTPDRA